MAEINVNARPIVALEIEPGESKSNSRGYQTTLTVLVVLNVAVLRASMTLSRGFSSSPFLTIN
jgi:hypothetical protein